MKAERMVTIPERLPEDREYDAYELKLHDDGKVSIRSLKISLKPTRVLLSDLKDGIAALEDSGG